MEGLVGVLSFETEYHEGLKELFGVYDIFFWTCGTEMTDMNVQAKGKHSTDRGRHTAELWQKIAISYISCISIEICSAYLSDTHLSTG
jgi:hypothetical protein